MASRTACRSSASVDRPPGRLDDQVAGFDPGGGGRAAVLDTLDEDAVTLRQADRSAHLPGDVARRDGDAEARAARRLAAAQGVDAGPKVGVGREREVEALADPVRVEADEPAGAVEQGATRRARGERCGVLDAAVDPPTAGAAECPRDRRHEAEGHAGPAPVAGAGPEDRGPDRQAVPGAPVERRGGAGVDIDDREVALAVVAGHRADEAAAVGEGHGDLVAAEVVGVGQDLARGEDDARAAGAAADPDDRRADPLGDGGDGGLEFFDDAHGRCAPVLCLRAAVDL